MKIISKHFGEIEVNDADIFDFSEGILGFEDEKRFVLINEEGEPIVWLQSVVSPTVCVPLIDPVLIMEDFKFKISKEVEKGIGIVEGENLGTFVVVVIQSDISKSTANLRSPILLNSEKKKGIQTILEDKNLEIRHLIFSEGKVD